MKRAFPDDMGNDQSHKTDDPGKSCTHGGKKGGKSRKKQSHLQRINPHTPGIFITQGKDIRFRSKKTEKNTYYRHKNCKQPEKYRISGSKIPQKKPENRGYLTGIRKGKQSDKNTGGNNGAILGVSDMDKSIAFYGGIMDYDKVEYDVTDVFEDLKGVPGGQYKLRRVMLTRSKPIEGPLSEVMGTSHIELVQRIDEEGVPAARKLYEGRLWGDPGFIHLCFDIRNMEEIRKAAASFGHEFVCDGGRDFKMGEANGHFTYIEDPDGTLIEFVETFKIPILKKFGIYLHLENRDDFKPLPSWILKCLRFMKSK